MKSSLRLSSAVPSILCTVCLALLGWNVYAVNETAPQDTIRTKVYVNGTYIGEGYSVSNSLLVPVQKLAPRLGYTVKVDEKACAAYLTSEVKNTASAWQPVEASKGNILYRDVAVIDGRVSAELEIKPALFGPSRGSLPITLLVTARNPAGKVVHREEVTTFYPHTGGRFFLKTEPFTSQENITSFDFVLSRYPASNVRSGE